LSSKKEIIVVDREALIQGVETARAVLETTPQGQEADAQLVQWLKDHQKASGVFETVSALVQSLADNPAAKITAQEIIDRVQRAQWLSTSTCTGGNCTVQVP
jgi:DNA-binding PucR family transcriptional regulator